MNSTRDTNVYDASGNNIQTMTGEQDVNTPGILQTTYQNMYTLNSDGSVAYYLTNEIPVSASYKDNFLEEMKRMG